MCVGITLGSIGSHMRSKRL